MDDLPFTNYNLRSFIHPQTDRIRLLRARSLPLRSAGPSALRSRTPRVLHRHLGRLVACLGPVCCSPQSLQHFGSFRHSRCTFAPAGDLQRQPSGLWLSSSQRNQPGVPTQRYRKSRRLGSRLEASSASEPQAKKSRRSCRQSWFASPDRELTYRSEQQYSLG